MDTPISCSARVSAVAAEAATAAGSVRLATDLLLVVLDVALHVLDERLLVADLRPDLRQVLVLRDLVAGDLGNDQRRAADLVALGERLVLLVLEVDVVELDLAVLDLLGETRS